MNDEYRREVLRTWGRDCFRCGLHVDDEWPTIDRVSGNDNHINNLRIVHADCAQAPVE